MDGRGSWNESKSSNCLCYTYQENQIKSSVSLVSPSKEIVSGAPPTELVRTSDPPKFDVFKRSVGGNVKYGARPLSGKSLIIKEMI